MDMTSGHAGRGWCGQPRKRLSAMQPRLVAGIGALLLASDGETVGAVHRLVPAGLKRNLRFTTAVVADRRVHLALGSEATTAAVRTSAGGIAQRRVTSRLERGAAGWTPAGPVCEPLLGVEALLSRCENELISAVTTRQRDVGILLHLTCTPWRMSSYHDDAQHSCRHTDNRTPWGRTRNTRTLPPMPDQLT